MLSFYKIMRRRAREMQKKRENSWWISERLCAVLQSFKRQHREKIFCMRGVSEVTETLRERSSQAISMQPKWGQKPYDDIETAVGWCRRKQSFIELPIFIKLKHNSIWK